MKDILEYLFGDVSGEKYDIGIDIVEIVVVSFKNWYGVCVVDVSLLYGCGKFCGWFCKLIF